MEAERSRFLRDILEPNLKEQEVLEYWTFILQGAGVQGFLKGGFIRDKVANHIRGTSLVPEDFDILVAGKIHSVLQVAKQNGAEVIERRWRKGTPVFRYKVASFDIDCEMGIAMGIRADRGVSSFEQVRLEDAKATDLDVNSLSLRLIPGNLEVFDPFDAVSAIAKGEISLLDSRSLYRNPENVFRAYRIADRLQCKISQRTIEYFRAHAHVVRRIRRPFLDSQLRLILDSSNAADLWRQMEQIGITQHILCGAAMSFEQAKSLLL